MGCPRSRGLRRTGRAPPLHGLGFWAVLGRSCGGGGVGRNLVWNWGAPFRRGVNICYALLHRSRGAVIPPRDRRRCRPAKMRRPSRGASLANSRSKLSWKRHILRPATSSLPAASNSIWAKVYAARSAHGLNGAACRCVCRRSSRAPGCQILRAEEHAPIEIKSPHRKRCGKARPFS